MNEPMPSNRPYDFSSAAALIALALAMLGGALVLSGLLALGRGTGAHALATGWLPLYGVFRYPEKWWTLTAFAAAGLTAPTTLQTAFEAPDGFVGAKTEAAAELEAIARYADAAAARPVTIDPMMTLGLWGSDPDADLGRAKTAFAAGDLAGSAGAAASASTLWAGAADLGRGRAVSLITLAVAVVLAVILAAVWLRGRRRRGHGTMRTEDFGA
jgi:hypothetical protein